MARAARFQITRQRLAPQGIWVGLLRSGNVAEVFLTAPGIAFTG